jgi:ElaB/YqjD/DUF883 family membrane-anchored ribosome-binding protein
MNGISDELGDDLEKVLRELHRVLKALGDSAENLRSSATGALEAAAPVRETMQDAQTAVEDQVKERPWTSLLIAFIAGAILGSLLGHSR